ncbi:MAG: hypothetical protein ACEY3F_06620, partial [Wolbachia sp.]
KNDKDRTPLDLVKRREGEENCNNVIKFLQERAVIDVVMFSIHSVTLLKLKTRKVIYLILYVQEMTYLLVILIMLRLKKTLQLAYGYNSQNNAVGSSSITGWP